MTGGTMELLDRAKIVDVETFAANGARHRVPTLRLEVIR